MLPMAFTCNGAAAVWHYGGRGLGGWLWSLATIANVYLALSALLDTRRRFAPRTIRIRRMSAVAFVVISIDARRRPGGRHLTQAHPCGA